LIKRWLLRLLALAALAGVGYGVYVIVREGTAASEGSRGAVQPALRRLAAAQDKLGRELEVMRPGAASDGVGSALRATQRAHETAVRVFRRRRGQNEPLPDEDQLGDALGAEFDYLDALRSTLVNRRSPLIKQLGDRAQTAKDAFTELPDSAGVEDGIRGTQAFLLWARSRS
jgi:hypothetical protein